MNLKVNPELWLVKYLWIFIILPKGIQLIVYSIFLFYFIYKKGFKLDKTAIFIFLMACIHLFAIFFQIFSNQNAELVRIIAAINTCSSWILAVCFYNNYKNDCNDYFMKISKYMFINMIILFLIYLLSYVSPDEFSFLGYTWCMKRNDFLTTGATKRFSGLMETVIGPGHLFCIGFPISLFYAKKIMKKPFVFIYGILCLIPVIETNSRVSTVVCIAILILSFMYLINEMISNRRIMIFAYFVLFSIVAMFVILKIDHLFEFVDEYWNLRGGSNNARFDIYNASINYVISESPVFGVGIKYMYNGFPYGSHCTYIGVLYKTGILGFICFIIGIFMVYYCVFKRNFKNPDGRFLSLAMLMYLLLLVFSDVDGCDWTVITLFIIFGVISNNLMVSKENYV